jgi:nucleoside-diphosphate-sugar epimerase
MRILVTGATGFIGYEVARQLAVAAKRPRLVVRRPIRGALLSKLDAEILAADLASPTSLARACEGMDAVIHLGARAAFESYSRLRPSIVDGSRSLVRAAIAAGVRRIVYAGTLLVYSSSDVPIDRGTQPGPKLGYGRAKWEAEQILAEESERAGVSFVSVRLPHVYGSRNLFFSQLAAGQGLIALPGRGNNLFSHMHIDDAARVMIAAAESDVEGAWPIGDRQPVSWKDYLAVLRDHYPRLRVIPLPARVARLGAELLRPVLALRRRPSVKTPGSVIGYNLNLEVNPNSLWLELGLEPSYPTIATGIPAVLDECVAYRWVHPVEDRTGW